MKVINIVKFYYKIFIIFGIQNCIISSSSLDYYSEILNNHNLGTSVPFVFYTERLPDDIRFMPTLGNGHLGFTVFDDSVYMNGIYNGRHGLSHRARIPNYSNITLIPDVDNDLAEPYHISYSLDVSTGVFQIKMENSQMKIIQLIYAHRFYNRAIVNHIFVYRLQAKGALRINIRHEPGQRTEDIDFSEPTTTSTLIKDTITATKSSPTTATSAIMMKMMMMTTTMNTTSSQVPIVEESIKSRRYSSSAASAFDDINYDDDDQMEEKMRNSNSIPSLFSSPSSFSSTATTFRSSVVRDNEDLIHMVQGYTKEVEDDSYQKSRKHVCCLWNHVPEQITLYEDQRSASYRFVMTADELCSVAQQEMTDILATSNKHLLKSHRAKWVQFWNDFSITVSDNLKLGKAIYGSIFYLASSLPSFQTNQPSNLYYGLSPTGLGRGGTNVADYEGHSFWDTEIWMLPAIIQMNPHWARILLNYRYRMLDVAKDNAIKDNFNGSKFPWESAFTGTEVTQPCCPLVALLQHHITADIGYALQNYFSITYDLEWIYNEGCPLAENIAEFWASRVDKDHSSDLYDIKYVMGPDEDHPNVTNNVYTNVVASYALKFGEFAKSICNKSTQVNGKLSSKWLEIANRLKVLYDGNLDYHPQFEGYEINDAIKQADVVLLGYPLMFPMKDSTRRNDLRIYENATRSDGPAMTWAMHAINHLDIGDYLKADKNFEKSYENYIQAPFQVWTEEAEGKGATNFLTGAGGFLQSIINGYAGLRYYLDRMEIMKPHMPPYSNAFKISGIKYLGSTFKITVDDNESLIRCTSLNEKQPLLLFDKDDQYEINTNFIYNITSKKITIKPKTYQFGIDNIYGNY